MVISGRGARQALLKVVAASVVIMVTGAANAACLPVTLQEHVIDMGDVVYTPGLPTLRVKEVRKEYNAVVVGEIVQYGHVSIAPGLRTYVVAH